VIGTKDMTNLHLPYGPQKHRHYPNPMDLDVPSANLSVGRDSNVPIGNVTSIDNMSTGDTEKNIVNGANPITNEMDLFRDGAGDY